MKIFAMAFLGALLATPLGFLTVLEIIGSNPSIRNAREETTREPDYTKYSLVATEDLADGSRCDIVRIPKGTPWTVENYESFSDSDAQVRCLIKAWKEANPEREFLRISPVCGACYLDPKMEDPTSQDFGIYHREPGKPLELPEDA